MKTKFLFMFYITTFQAIFVFAGDVNPSHFLKTTDPKTPLGVLDIKYQNFKTSADRDSMIHSRKAYLQTLTQKEIDPYTGRDSTPEICQQSQLPKVISGSNYNIISLYSSHKKVLGFCPNRDDILKTQYLIIFCKDTDLWLIRYYYSKELNWKINPIVKCR